MGSNQNKSGDRKAAREWGSRARKEEAASKARSLEERAIEDSVASNDLDDERLYEDDPEGWRSYSPYRAPFKRRKKDTAKWCRGKEGREHKEFLMESRRARWFSFDKYRCEVCGKERTEWKR